MIYSIDYIEQVEDYLIKSKNDFLNGKSRDQEYNIKKAIELLNKALIKAQNND